MCFFLLLFAHESINICANLKALSSQKFVEKFLPSYFLNCVTKLIFFYLKSNLIKRIDVQILFSHTFDIICIEYENIFHVFIAIELNNRLQVLILSSKKLFVSKIEI